jgi:glyoxylase-like metal-dependent hydrolase (beta-lactamase superfamily II)
MFYPYLQNRIRSDLFNFIERNEPLYEYWGRTFYCNSFQLLIGTERAVLIDTGYAYGDLLELTESYTALPVDLLVTHSDRDHRRGAPQFAGIGRKIYMSDLEILPSREEEKFPFETLKDGDVFDLGGGTVLETIHVPGHTKGSMCFLDRKHNQLFTGDAVNKLPWLFSGRGGTVSSYLESLYRLKSLTPDEPDIFCGHAWEPFPYKVLLDSIIACEDVLAGSSKNDRKYALPFTQESEPLEGVYEHQVGDVRLCYSIKYII